MADFKFVLADLRLSQDFTSLAGRTKVITTVPVGRPDKLEYVRVHPHEDYRLEPAALLEINTERGRESYVVHERVLPLIESEAKIRALFVAVNRRGDPSIWPVGIPGPDGRTNPWNESAMQAALRAMHTWVRVVPNQRLGAYDVHVPSASLPEPDFPTLKFEELLQIAFGDRIIDQRDHPILRRLRGEV